MRKEHIKKLKKTDYDETDKILNLTTRLMEVNVSSSCLINRDEIDDRLNYIYHILYDLTELLAEKDFLIEDIVENETKKEKIKIY